ncbi:hypothetical protein OYC64_009754 [Pagothenia borchgrevinki]|uniref:Uncharacterized protein n=1 Tax=Pagothenia borchgrevinki TaxID=8213 RepID=A0ABD2H5N5_PAGBO
MTALSVRRSTWLCFGMSVFLLLIFMQMLTSLVQYAGVFILSNETLISPFHFCLARPHGELSCNDCHWNALSRGESGMEMCLLDMVVYLGLYIPVVLVAFALLAMLLAIYGKDITVLWFSMACQAASSLLILTGLIVFLVQFQSYVSWEHLTIWFYVCVAVQVQLVIITVLTYVLRKRLSSD